MIDSMEVSILSRIFSMEDSSLVEEMLWFLAMIRRPALREVIGLIFMRNLIIFETNTEGKGGGVTV